ncbi:hypothetical protein DZC78_10590 [Olleya aquimaris]|uniref:ABC transporter permease n=1 Tax=Olleya sediminilitoris TaxID=2795739 RepID=A0ABS1WHF3_9FLAO|nr:DUF5687 family protein [Olleya sediminilitoris]AXO80812.1 hypothetical protein DZC78_10590 [Olleya aquimaris]MBL7558543.1 hypothetical protein [Olleya sediminilitoris]
MITKFLSLEWKSFIRSSNFGKGLAIKILMAFFAVYFLLVFLSLGVFIYPTLKKAFPDNDPFVMVNTLLFFWFLGDLMLRFFLQKLPVMSVKPLLTLPIKRSRVVNYVLGKSALSFFNFLPLFAIVPFSVVLITKDYEVTKVITWLVAMVILTLISNFLNFIIESFSAETEFSFLPIILFAGTLFGLNHFNIVNFSQLLSSAMLAITNNPLYLIVLLIILIGLYLFNHKVLIKKLYLDNSLKTKIKEVSTSDLGWTKRFGEVAPFMQLDLKLIWRNKRPRSAVFILVIGLLYGLFFYPQPMYRDMPIMYGFIGVFVTGIFLINFGQFIPAWDSGYYKMLMSQNIKYEQYLKSKYTLMMLSVIIMFVLSIPYVYFGWKILVAHFAAAIYNIGVNTYVIMLGGSFNRKKIDLNQRAAFNYQGTGAVQWLIGIPLLLVPLAIFGALTYYVNFYSGVSALILLGIIGIVFHQKLMQLITKKYLNSKYEMIKAFNQDN